MPILNTPFLPYKIHWSHSVWIWACLFLAIIPTDREQEGKGEKRGLEAGVLWWRRYEQTVERLNAPHDKEKEFFPLKTQIIQTAKESGLTNGNGLDWDCWCSYCFSQFSLSAPVAWTSKLLDNPCLSVYSSWSVWGEPPVVLAGIKTMLCKPQQFISWLNIFAVWLGQIVGGSRRFSCLSLSSLPRLSELYSQNFLVNLSFLLVTNCTFLPHALLLKYLLILPFSGVSRNQQLSPQSSPHVTMSCIWPSSSHQKPQEIPHLISSTYNSVPFHEWAGNLQQPLLSILIPLLPARAVSKSIPSLFPLTNSPFNLHITHRRDAFLFS